VHADRLKAEAVGRIRKRLRDAGRTWIAQHLPGVFASDAPSSIPAWDLLVTRHEQLHYEPPPNSRADWRDTLGLGFVYERWSPEDLPGLYLAVPHDPRADWSNAVPTFCGIEDELLRQHELDEPSAQSYFWRTRQVVADLLALWTFQLALASHERRFAEIGDRLAEPEKRLRATGKRLRQLQRDVMPLAFDLGTLERGSQNDPALRLLLRDVRKFKAIPVRLANDREICGFSDTLPELLRGPITDEGRRTGARGLFWPSYTGGAAACFDHAETAISSAGPRTPRNSRRRARPYRHFRATQHPKVAALRCLRYLSPTLRSRIAWNPIYRDAAGSTPH
jgi:hypothetical protein